MWLQFGGREHQPPEQLPVVLQVLLSQAHRLRALLLLRRFVALGPWAVNLALSVGIFPYVLKLLQSPAPELRQVLVCIWATILAFDRTCQADLVKDSAHLYFLAHLSAPLGWAEPDGRRDVADIAGLLQVQQRTTTAYVLTAMVDNFRQGQAACLAKGLHRVCVELLRRECSERASGLLEGATRSTTPTARARSTSASEIEHSALRCWLCFALGSLCRGYPEACAAAMGDDVDAVSVLRHCLDEREESSVEVCS